MHFPPMCKVNTLVTILCWCIAGQLPELPAADPGMFPNMLPNMFNLSALGQVTTVLLLWFSVASTQIMDSPLCHHNATRFTLICSLFGDEPTCDLLCFFIIQFNVLLLLSNFSFLCIDLLAMQPLPWHSRYARFFVLCLRFFLFCDAYVWPLFS